MKPPRTVPALVGLMLTFSAAAIPAQAELPPRLPRAAPPPPELVPEPSAPLTTLPPEHWSRQLLSRLELPPAEAPTPGLPLRTRWDAALRLARWLERGTATGAEAAETLIVEFAPELLALGVTPLRARERLSNRRGSQPGGRLSWHDSPRRRRTLRLLDRTLSDLERLDRELGTLRTRMTRPDETAAGQDGQADDAP